MAVTLPLVIILIDFLLSREGGRFRLRKVRFYIPYLSVLAGYFLLRILFLRNLGGYADQNRNLLHIDLGFLNDLRNLVTRPLAALAVPLNRSVFANSGFLQTVFLLVIAACVAGLAFRKRRASPLILPGVFLTIIAVLPAFRILFISPDLQGSRHLYLAVLGACFIIAGVVESFDRTSGRMVRALPVMGSIVLLGFMIWISCLQAAPWVRGGELTRRIIEAGVGGLSSVKPGTTAYVDGLPDNEQGAYVFRNGFLSAMHLAGIGEDIHIVEFKKVPLSEIERKDGNLVLHWDGVSFRSSEWSYDRLISEAKKR